jgi:hypothetical protein
MLFTLKRVTFWTLECKGSSFSKAEEAVRMEVDSLIASAKINRCDACHNLSFRSGGSDNLVI